MKKYDVSFTQDRELSWLKFNERVLGQAKNRNVPLFERLRFLDIFTNNLDEFFMVRVGSIHEMILIQDSHRDIRSNLTPEGQLSEIRSMVRTLYKERDEIYKELKNEVQKIGMFHAQKSDLSERERKYLKVYFDSMILPVLSPMVVTRQHPFPNIPNKELQIGLILKKKEKQSFGMVPVPGDLERLIFVPGNEKRFLLLEEVMELFCDSLFEHYEVMEKTIFGVTRSADINPDDEIYETDEDYRMHMKKIIKLRRRLEPVRVEFYRSMPESLKDYLNEKLELTDHDSFKSNTPLQLKYLDTLIKSCPKSTRADLSYPKMIPSGSRSFIPNLSVTKQILEKDRMLSFPFESMEPFITLLKESAEDKETISIKITIYRLAKQAKIVKYLCEAAENGKEVLVIMELRARFDEENNINYAEILEEAGCKVIYGFEKYKIHSKICLVTKKSGKRIRYITQIGTGNYNESTSKVYTDLSLMTASEKIGRDAARFFHNMATANVDGDYKYLLVAPKEGLKDRILEMIHTEAVKAESGQASYIFMKMNSLTDRQIIDALSEASCAGVRIFLLIRGICCLVPGIKGKTEHIHVQSIVGRFLEHSRIYCFGAGDEMKIYISSADMMTRNTRRRIEIACPVCDDLIRKRMKAMIQIMWKDTVNTSVLKEDGIYYRKEDGGTLDSHTYFLAEAAREQAQPAEKNRGLLHYFLTAVQKR
ncbi:polyphosphate kinase 1 [Anaerostipes sp.]|uniref:polyphosphate kinase 1 n=1 Tax=Anaerostipes sp. TaxID=1872530 RepID=UPI0025C5B2F5|nr:polyphosphate kinase 1 [Anaerostipes sp.]MBS7008457.1 polyphosphate kinase 1 [Anaerostipes sp.]